MNFPCAKDFGITISFTEGMIILQKSSIQWVTVNSKIVGGLFVIHKGLTSFWVEQKQVLSKKMAQIDSLDPLSSDFFRVLFLISSFSSSQESWLGLLPLLSLSSSDCWRLGNSQAAMMTTVVDSPLSCPCPHSGRYKFFCERSWL